MAKLAIEESERERQAAIEEFESYVSRVQEQFGVDRATAIRWDMDAYGSVDKEDHCFQRGLPFSYEDKF